MAIPVLLWHAFERATLNKMIVRISIIVATSAEYFLLLKSYLYSKIFIELYDVGSLIACYFHAIFVNPHDAIYIVKPAIKG